MGLEPTTDNSSLHHVRMGEGGSILLELLVFSMHEDLRGENEYVKKKSIYLLLPHDIPHEECQKKTKFELFSQGYD
jgi:hypothetical protein